MIRRGAKESLMIMAMIDGGFVVSNPYRVGDLRCDLYACSTIEEALEYIKAEMTEPGAT